MAMSISSAQMLLQVASAENTAPAGRSIQAAVPATPTPAQSPTQTPSAAAPPVSSPSAFSTGMQIDNHHQIYYVVVNDSTGDVLFEIPSEALRKIGESLNLPLIGDESVPSVDVKS
jgi:hypothetical protein